MEDAAVRCSARLPVTAADQAAQAGGQWLGVIDAILEDDRLRPAKQRHAANRATPKNPDGGSARRSSAQQPASHVRHKQACCRQ
jgi:hypothetical protein